MGVILTLKDEQMAGPIILENYWKKIFVKSTLQSRNL